MELFWWCALDIGKESHFKTTEKGMNKREFMEPETWSN